MPDRKSENEKGRRPPPPSSFADRFRHEADRLTRALGTPWAMAGAGLIIVVWAVTGPVFGFSDTWQLVINTGTTIITFLMVFAIQTTQNREALSIQIKLDELIRATGGARNRTMAAEEESEEELDREHLEYEREADSGKSGGAKRGSRRAGRSGRARAPRANRGGGEGG